LGILTKPLLRPQQRWDLEDFNTALSALRADSHFYTKRFIADKSYILQGFTISQAFIGQPTADVTLTDATLINGDNTGDVSWWTAPESASPLTLPVGVGGLQGGRNYVELEVYSEDGTPLQRAFWDPSANSGAGVEFTQEVDTVTELFVRAKVNQTGFTVGNPNLIPLAVIDLDGSLNIRGIKDKRELLFRLGTPDDIDDSFTWGSRSEPATTLVFATPSGTAFEEGETVTFSSGATAVVTLGGTNNVQVFDFSTDSHLPGDLVTGGTSGATATLQSYYESFTGADKDIRNYRDMFAALMNEIRLVKGTRFWYEAGNALSLPSVLDYVNAIVAPIASGAKFAWSGSALSITDDATSGQATSDVIAAVRIPGKANDYYLTREDGTGGSATVSIPDQSILYVELPSSGDRTFSESGPGVTNFRVVDIGSFIPSDKNFILAYREGTKVILTGLGELEAGETVEVGDGVSSELLAFIGSTGETDSTPPYSETPSAELPNDFSSADSLTEAISKTTANLNVVAESLLSPYQERLSIVSGVAANDNELQGPVSSGTSFTIPLDSRNANVQKTYTVGQGGLVLFLNGIHLTLGEDYAEVGAAGSQSSTVQILDDLVVDDELDVRIINPQSFL
jgi:hypothetical protein